MPVTTDAFGDTFYTGDYPVTTTSVDTSTPIDTTQGSSFWDMIGIDPSTVNYSGGQLTNNQILQQIGAQDSSTAATISNLLATAGTGAVNYLKGLFTDPTSGNTDWKKVAGLAGGLYGAYQSRQQQQQPRTGYQGSIPRYEAIREAVPATGEPRAPGSSGQRYFSQLRYAAPGEGATAARAAAKEEVAGLQALNKGQPAPAAPAAAPQTTFAAGGLSTLAKSGKYLDGATDGMADKIPARIDGKQEARLSHGEFVVPADVVSHLGNGNSSAGAQRLYEMLERVRKARTGNAQQGKQINPNKFLPS